MKKILLSVFLCAATVLATNAQVFTENFETATVGGNVEGYNGWYVSNKGTEALGVSPKIAAGPLSYTNYASSGVGNVAVLDPAMGDDATTQRISTKLVTLDSESLKAAPGEKIYVAFLAKISGDSKKAIRDFFTLEGSSTSSNTRGRLFARVTDEGDLSFGVSKNTGTAAQIIESGILNINATHLLVMVYEGIEGDSNDKVRVYINPDLTKTEAEQTIVLEATDTATDYSTGASLGINLRQRGVGANIGGIRVAKTWENAVSNGLTGINDNATDNGIIVSTKYYNLNGVEVNEPVNTKNIYVKKDIYENGSVKVTKVIK